MKNRTYFVEFSRSWRALLRRVKDFTKCGKFSLKLEHLSTTGSTELEAATFHMYKVTFIMICSLQAFIGFVV